ncbi:hypothetical protein H2248_005970 [Termitomyces sp. 'cryptogamus']|nr:hypothetical protein H2248_005970 [Termitomyces sp. 'cryptogamus']
MMDKLPMEDASPFAVDNTMGAALIGVFFAGILYGGILSIVSFSFHRINGFRPSILRSNLVLLRQISEGRLVYQSAGWLHLDLRHYTPSLNLTYRLKLKTWVQLEQLKGLSMVVNILAALGDGLIAGTLCYFLQRSRTGFKKSDTMISKLILFTVSTGVLTSICAIASLISILVWPSTLIYAAFYFCLGRLYSNSVLATLNARQSIRELGEDNDELSFSFRMRPMFSKTFENVFSTKSQPLNSNRCTNISIKIDTSQQYDRDLTRLEDQPDSATTNNFSYKEQYIG